MNHHKFFQFLLTIAILGYAGFAKGHKIISQTTNGHDKTETVTILLDMDNLKIESQGINGHSIVFFNGADKVLNVANISDGTLMEITEADLERIKSSMSDVHKAMNKPEMKEAMDKSSDAMKDMSEDQKKMADKHMPDAKGDKMGMMKDDDKIMFSKAGTETVNDWNCTKYSAKINDSKTKEIWTTDLATLGLTKENLAIFDKLHNFVEVLGAERQHKILPKMDFTKMDMDEKYGYSGVPVKTNIIENGNLTRSTKLTEVSEVALTANDFKIPEGLTQLKTLEEMPQATTPRKR